MRFHLRVLFAAALAVAVPALAQNPFPVTLEKQLAARATNFTEVSLDKNMLTFASKFLDNKDADDAKVKALVNKLQGVYVRTYEFEKPGQYTPDDLEAIRRQFSGGIWSSMVRERTRDHQGDTDVYVKLVNGEIQGLFVLNAEPKELNFVFIDGPVRPEDLNELGGNFGIPKIGKGKEAGK